MTFTINPHLKDYRVLGFRLMGFYIDIFLGNLKMINIQKGMRMFIEQPKFKVGDKVKILKTVCGLIKDSIHIINGISPYIGYRDGLPDNCGYYYYIGPASFYDYELETVVSPKFKINDSVKVILTQSIWDNKIGVVTKICDGNTTYKVTVDGYVLGLKEYQIDGISHLNYYPKLKFNQTVRINYPSSKYHNERMGIYQVLAHDIYQFIIIDDEESYTYFHISQLEVV